MLVRSEEIIGLQGRDRCQILERIDILITVLRGEEITADVFEEHANEIFEEAENRLHAQKAVLVECMADEMPEKV